MNAECAQKKMIQTDFEKDERLRIYSQNSASPPYAARLKDIRTDPVTSNQNCRELSKHFDISD